MNRVVSTVESAVMSDESDTNFHSDQYDYLRPASFQVVRGIDDHINPDPGHTLFEEGPSHKPDAGWEVANAPESPGGLSSSPAIVLLPHHDCAAC